ncbi:orc1/cdc6 family replication initiation protein [Haloterrigena turkmenica DSM 5511]|uniref:ORC1-type DNA replication protein n=1 Tax=Haloterrigena turkmenica (strain ATCC 51198 / DSM 5511 / JCM 9101 / NCIMB 13204 / VKM B-1734 / 4k) TaxID=543526 RepID=D2RPB0_HALTV|nr:AAA family ATPase [Haloterrigena turkmenica]ADB60144.1 orc1/cdc6 family replication initiation protein [Haloterrigena turkmenica DSM 5511]
MSKYDDLFAETAPANSVFANKRALDPLADPAEIAARDSQERALATLINGVHDGYLPPTVSIYGPPGTGKTLTTRRICREFAARHDDVAVEYVNLKECRTLFSAANEILFALTGAKKGAYEGLDGVFTGIWTALEAYPEWTVLVLDEIDHVQHDTNYDPSDFFYRLLRGEGRLSRGIELSVWLISNELLEVDLRLDSRVESAMSDEQVFFPPYDSDALAAVLAPRLERAFRDGVLPADVRDYGVREAARRWGDARKALTLFRQAGETATDRGLETVTDACIDANLETTEREATIDKLLDLPENHFLVLTGVTGWSRGTEIKQPVTTAEIHEVVQDDALPADLRLGERAIRDVITDLETMGLVETWIDARGAEGRVKQIETTFDPRWVRDVIEPYVTESTYLATLETD